MIKYKGIVMPDGETHLPSIMDDEKSAVVGGRGTYQAHKLKASLRVMKALKIEKLTAVDVGANIGMWSIYMANIFDHVEAFEPAWAMRECFIENTRGQNNIRLHHEALGAKRGKAPLIQGEKGHCGNIFIDPDYDEDIDTDVDLVTIKKLDSFKLENVTFLKIDCEGYEQMVLEGATKTLEQRPVICVEQKPGWPSRHGLEEQGAVKLLKDMGARVFYEIGGDYIMGWK